ncbi:dNA primase [Intestinibacter bartlettii CAG:1329]|uniref:DNA primase n=1 Tax=Intestinibacter bartlettii CAG:1329 TaxID=1263063 RepID=R5X1P8_9FIRM|nr:DNA primase [Intestinibacter bartlettii]CDA09648.1 dNA primase [Intestinibacter bartlettii CAG:1329]
MNDLKDIIEEIKSRCDIVDIISDYMHLEKSGSNYTGLCPFHSEKTGSFMVSKSKQIYKCFGCNAGGDVISFVMRWENVDFMEAVKILARKCGITLDRNISEEEKKKIQEINKFREIHTEAARFYFANLLRTKNPGYEYLRKRGLSDKIIKKFGLGYSPNSWNSLMNYLLSKGYDKTDLVKCGLITHKTESNKYFDRFRNRVMFPIFNYNGKVIGFGGRVLDDSLPKYLNSPETLVFNKRMNLYGLNISKKGIKDDTLILVEGYMDLISLYQNNIENVVATLGTALTIEQAKLIRRFAKNVIISYDSDQAGQNATLRAIDILLKADIKVKILNLKDCKDPDDFIKKYGFDGYKKAIEESDYYIKFKIDLLKNKYNLKNDTQKMNFVEESTLMLKKLKSPIEKDLYAKYLSDLTNISVDSIRASIGIKVSRNYNNKNNAKYTNVHRKIEQMSKIQDGYLKVETNFIKLLMENKELRNSVISDIKSDEFSIDETKEIFNYIIKNKELDKITIDKIKSLNISEEYIKNINNIEIEEINTYTIDSTKEIIKKIRKNTIENEIKSMSIQIERLSKELDLLKKSNSNTKEVDDKIMKLSLEILKREKIKKDL